MSRELTACFHGDYPSDVYATFCNVIRKLEKIKGFRSEWSYLDVKSTNLVDRLFQSYRSRSVNTMTVEEIDTQLKLLPQDVPVAVRARNLLEISELYPELPPDIHMLMDVSLMNSGEWGIPRLLKNCTASIELDIKELSAHLYPSRKIDFSSYISDSLIEIISTISKVLLPESIHTYFLDHTLAYPGYSHLSYFASHEHAAKEMTCYLEKICTSFKENQNITNMFSNNETKQNILNTIVRKVDPEGLKPITADAVKRVLESGNFDIITNEQTGKNGFFVLKYTEIDRQTIDDFYLELFKQTVV
jgi:hypothetical protein